MNLAGIFASINNRQFTYSDLRTEIEKILSSSDRYLPAEISRRDILAAASSNGWIVAESDKFRVVLPQAVAATASAFPTSDLPAKKFFTAKAGS
jgi:hypothetical protein